jgi:signal-transduction protein with cAMP-binding, CBS, and nucleotidyltransferase domain
MLSDYFPGIDISELKKLKNRKISEFKSNHTLACKGDKLDIVHLILSGRVDYFYGDMNTRFELTAGSMIGITNSIWGNPTVGKYQTANNVKTLMIPINVMRDFLTRNNLLDSLKSTNQIVQVLRQSYLFGSRISSRKLVKLAQRVGIIHLIPGDVIPNGWPKDLYFINKGTINVLKNGIVTGTLNKGDSWGGYPVYPIWKELDFEAQIPEDTAVELYRFSYDQLKEIPVIQWKLFQLWSCWAASP